MLIHKLPEELLEYQKLARDFAQRELARAAHDLDKHGEFPRAHIKSAFDSGLLNMAVPESYGGLGLSVLDNCVITEELAWGEAGVAGSISASDIASRFLLDFGSDEQKLTYLTPLLEEPTLAGYGMTGGLKEGKLFFRKEGSEYFINGKHPFVLNGGVAKWYLVRASEDRRDSDIESEPLKQDFLKRPSYTYFIVRADEDGLSFDDRVSTLGRRSQVITTARFDEVMLEASAMLGSPGQAAEFESRIIERTYPLIASVAVGVARAAMEHALKYAKERQTFKVPIGNHQGVSFMLADMAKDIEAARLLVYQAAQLADKGLPCATEAVCAKAFAQEMCMRVTTDAVQVFGGYGFSKEYPVEKLMRDAKVGQIIDGTSEHMKVELGRQLVTSL